MAWRSPPRLSRCRLVLPDDAGTGLTPHSEAKAASEWRRGRDCCRRRSAGPQPCRSYAEGFDQCWCRSLGKPFKLGLQVLDLLAELTVTTGKRAKSILGRCRGIVQATCCRGIVQATGAEASATFNKGAGGQTIKRFSELSRSCDNQCLHLVDGLGTSLYGRVLRALEHTDHLYFALARLGSRGGDTGKHCARCHLRICRITLSLAIADRPVRSVDLDDRIAPIGPRDHQPALRRVDRDVRIRESDRRSARSSDSPRSHHRNERRQLPPQAEQSGRRDAIIRQSCDIQPDTAEGDIFAQQLALTFMLNNNSLMVHFSAAPVVLHCPALDSHLLGAGFPINHLSDL